MENQTTYAPQSHNTPSQSQSPSDTPSIPRILSNPPSDSPQFAFNTPTNTDSPYKGGSPSNSPSDTPSDSPNANIPAGLFSLNSFIFYS